MITNRVNVLRSACLSTLAACICMCMYMYIVLFIIWWIISSQLVRIIFRSSTLSLEKNNPLKPYTAVMCNKFPASAHQSVTHYLVFTPVQCCVGAVRAFLSNAIFHNFFLCTAPSDTSCVACFTLAIPSLFLCFTLSPYIITFRLGHCFGFFFLVALLH